jgi:hypothetical protein
MNTTTKLSINVHIRYHINKAKQAMELPAKQCD